MSAYSNHYRSFYPCDFSSTLEKGTHGEGSIREHLWSDWCHLSSSRRLTARWVRFIISSNFRCFITFDDNEELRTWKFGRPSQLHWTPTCKYRKLHYKTWRIPPVFIWKFHWSGTLPHVIRHTRLHPHLKDYLPINWNFLFFHASSLYNILVNIIWYNVFLNRR